MKSLIFSAALSLVIGTAFAAHNQPTPEDLATLAGLTQQEIADTLAVQSQPHLFAVINYNKGAIIIDTRGTALHNVCGLTPTAITAIKNSAAQGWNGRIKSLHVCFTPVRRLPKNLRALLPDLRTLCVAGADIENLDEIKNNNPTLRIKTAHQED